MTGFQRMSRLDLTFFVYQKSNFYSSGSPWHSHVVGVNRSSLRTCFRRHIEFIVSSDPYSRDELGDHGSLVFFSRIEFRASQRIQSNFTQLRMVGFDHTPFQNLPFRADYNGHPRESYAPLAQFIRIIRTGALRRLGLELVRPSDIRIKFTPLGRDLQFVLRLRMTNSNLQTQPRQQHPLRSSNHVAEAWPCGTTLQSNLLHF